MYLQTDALGTIDDFEIEDLSKVHSKVGVQGATVCPRDFFAVVQDLDEKRVSSNIFPPSHFSPKQSEKETHYCSNNN